jgi:S1-C subfamily serine protease
MRILIFFGLCIFLSTISFADGTQKAETNFKLKPEPPDLVVEPPAIQTQARCVPTPIVNAPDCLKFKGFRCLQILEKSPYAKAGMKDGDVIFEINAKPAIDPGVLMEAFGGASKKAIKLKICRHDKIIVLKFKK